jgi:very-short-patch-repair endonuclease
MVYIGKTVEKDMYFGAKPELLKRAREMRKNPTDSEKKLWKELQKFRTKGFIFRRQHPIDIFIADFYCHKLRLIIEADGEIHDNEESQEYDEGRSAELEKYDIKVLRFKNSEVLNNINKVTTTITTLISEISSPSLPGEGDMRG